MKRGGCFANLFGVGATSAFVVLLVFCTSAGAAFFEKQYLVRNVQGKDVLCDPYVVQKDDWVLHLFRQRGEIAHKDFPKFLALFKILNPGVHDIDTIYPGQEILIPLRKVPPGSFVGQDTGIVTLPVITLTRLPDTIHNQPTQYKIRYGDWVSKLIAERFGPVGTESYKRGEQLFKMLNPEIKNIDFILPGQTVHLPTPDMEMPGYAKPVEMENELVDLTEFSISISDEKHASDRTDYSPGLEQVKPRERKDGAKSGFPAKSEAAERMRGFSDRSVFVKAGTILDADIISSGTYYFPRRGKPDFNLVLSETPLMRFQDGTSILFTRRQWLSAENQQILQMYWPDTKIVFFEDDTQLRTLISTIIPIIDSGGGYEGHLNVNHDGLTVAVRGQYIYHPAHGRNRVCLNILDNPEMRLPKAIQDYFAGLGISVREWIETENLSGWAGNLDTGNYRIPEVTHISANRPDILIKTLARELGYRYQSDVNVSFPYAGFQVNIQVDMLSLGNGGEVLIDYGGLGGRAVDSIEQTGFRVVRMENHNEPKQLIDQLARLLQLELTIDPVFWTAARPRLYNPSIQIPGYMISRRPGEQALSQAEIERRREIARQEEISRIWGSVRYVDPREKQEEQRRAETAAKAEAEEFRLFVSLVPIPGQVASYLVDSGIRLIEVSGFTR